MDNVNFDSMNQVEHKGNYYIYEIENLINHKTYIGQHKIQFHQKDTYMGSGTILKQAQKKYGINNFQKTILCYADTKEKIDKLEIEYIQKYREQGKAEYNIADGGGGNAGYHHSEETKEKLRQSTTKYLRNKYKEIYELRMSVKIPDVQERLWEKVERTNIPEEVKRYFYIKIFYPEKEELKKGYYKNLKYELFQEQMKEMERQQYEYEKNNFQ